MDDLPLMPIDPRDLPAPEGELYRRRTRAAVLLESCEQLDPDRRAEVSAELLRLGPDAVPALTRAALSAPAATADLARELLRLLVPDEIGRLIHTGLLREKQAFQVELGAALLARIGHPTLSIKGVLADIDALALRARLRICERLELKPSEAVRLAARDPLPIVQGLSEFWRDEGFHGNNENYYSELNSYLPDVLERRTGLPIALTVLFLALARRLGLKADGVGLPGHFIARVRVKITPQEHFVLVDPFSGLQTLSIGECRQRVEALGQPFVAEEHLKAAPSREILVRMCNNLLALFDRDRRSLDAECVATVLVHLQPLDPVPLLIRAERRLRRKERRSARADLERAATIDPDGPAGRTAADMLRKLDVEHPFKY